MQIVSREVQRDDVLTSAILQKPILLSRNICISVSEKMSVNSSSLSLSMFLSARSMNFSIYCDCYFILAVIIMIKMFDFVYLVYDSEGAANILFGGMIATNSKIRAVVLIHVRRVAKHSFRIRYI